MSEPRDEIAEVLAVELHVDCPFGNEHITQLRNVQTGAVVKTCHDCYLTALDVTNSDWLAERDRRVAGAALRRFADRFRPGDGNPWALHVRTRARRAAEQIEGGE